MFSLEMLPARQGDCLWLEYGDPASPCRVLIDGGTASTQRVLKERLLELPAEQRGFELMVVTHVDADHAQGVLGLIRDPEVRLNVGDFWFNGSHQVQPYRPSALQPIPNDLLTQELRKAGLPLNRQWSGEAIVVPPEGALPVAELPGGLKLTVLSPGHRELENLGPTWADDVEKAGLAPDGETPPEPPLLQPIPDDLEPMGPVYDVHALAERPFEEDSSRANRSSVVLLGEFEGHRVLLAGDAPATLLEAGIARLDQDGPLALDAFKLPHHGSAHHVSQELLQRISCKRFLVSTNGERFQHPDAVALARVVKWGGDALQLFFNYRSRHTAPWEDPRLTAEHCYTVEYPGEGEEGLKIEL